MKLSALLHRLFLGLAWVILIGGLGCAIYWVLHLQKTTSQLTIPLPPITLLAAPPQPVTPATPVSTDQRPAYQKFARILQKPVHGARIAIVITDVGPNEILARSLIQDLPAEITLAFSAYTPNLSSVMRQARAFGHETVLMMPMEPSTYPRRDPGPLTLLTGMKPAEMLNRLTQILHLGQDYVGVTNYMGSRFMNSTEDMRPLLKELRAQGVLFLDSQSAYKSAIQQIAEEISLPYLQTTDNIDVEISAQPLSELLQRLIDRSAEHSTLVVRLSAMPAVVETLKTWVRLLPSQSITLVPLTSVLPASQRPKLSV
jgi:polysaccharide deacetylase 2 family uncharacterized protein YibQ